MVFLRLSVKVLPQEHGAGGKPFFLMVPLHNPEDVTLGKFASVIQEKWQKLRPGVGPLDIKKILHESYPDVDLDMYLTVADVFVQYGRATADGQQDQRATVLVIQTPSTTSKEESQECPPENPQSSVDEHEISSDELGTSPTPKTVSHASGRESIDDTTVASGEPERAGSDALPLSKASQVQPAHTIGTKAPGCSFPRGVISIDCDLPASNFSKARRPRSTTNSKVSSGSASDKCPTDKVQSPSTAGRSAVSTPRANSQIVKSSGTRNSPIVVESDETSD